MNRHARLLESGSPWRSGNRAALARPRSKGVALALLVIGDGKRPERHRAQRDREADQDRAKQAAA
jgi:hypothetical protein